MPGQPALNAMALCAMAASSGHTAKRTFSNIRAQLVQAMGKAGRCIEGNPHLAGMYCSRQAWQAPVQRYGMLLPLLICLGRMLGASMLLEAARLFLTVTALLLLGAGLLALGAPRSADMGWPASQEPCSTRAFCQIPGAAASKGDHSHMELRSSSRSLCPLWRAQSRALWWYLPVVTLM